MAGCRPRWTSPSRCWRSCFPFLLVFHDPDDGGGRPDRLGDDGRLSRWRAGQVRASGRAHPITFPYLALISLVSLLGGILNSVDRFWVNAAAPILLTSICLMIVGLVFFRGHDPVETAFTQAISVTVSGVAQLAWLMWACARAGTSLRFRRPRLNPKVKQLLHIIWPAALGAGSVQFILLISTSLAARFLPQGAVSYLYYADR